MVALETPPASLGWRAEDFSLKGTDGQTYTLHSTAGPKGLLVVFMCNHCPYVQKQLERVIFEASELKKLGINTVAIMSNDIENYPDDSFENMQKLAQEMRFPFPYLLDETQQVARAYGAVCTPDFFGFNADLTLQYRGRLDESWSQMIAEPKRELFEAMKEIAANGATDLPQRPSIGCSIKWKESVAA